MIQLLVAVALVLTVAASSAAQGVRIRFSPASEQFAEAAREYQSLWEAEGGRIIEALEHVFGLKFAEREIQAVVYEGISRAGSQGTPMRMRASYPAWTKKATLIHELGHRHLAQLRWRPSELDEHRVLFLFLYDVWERLYGKGFGEEQVEVEKKRKGVYDYEAASGSNPPMELMTHSIGFWGYSWRFLLWTAAHRGRWARSRRTDERCVDIFDRLCWMRQVDYCASDTNKV